MAQISGPENERMRPMGPWHGLAIQSLIKATGEFELSLERQSIDPPDPGQVVVRVKAAPINPSDIGLLFGAANLEGLAARSDAERTVTTGLVPSYYLRAMAERLDVPLAVGNEGAGVVVAAGSDQASQSLLGRTVAVMAGGMYAQYRKVQTDDCLVLPAGTTAAEAASCFVNPLTALGMVTTVRQHGQEALVHTAAASSLGRILNRVCVADGIQLVSVVRTADQAASLRGDGAKHVCTSTVPSFRADLHAALKATGATILFDAIGGGRLAGQILAEMEVAAAAGGHSYSVYGSARRKIAYLYGSLDPSPTELKRNFGRLWTVSGWLLHDFIEGQSPEVINNLKKRIAAEVGTTFRSSYIGTLSLTQTLDPDRIAKYCRLTTDGKYIIEPAC